MLKTAMIGSAAIALPYYWFHRWNYIVIHHSAGPSGNLETLRKVHRERQWRDPIDMVPYHFIIGNGNGMAMGEVKPTRRWNPALWGAHVNKKARDWNFRGIGICLIGNFQDTEMPEIQYRSLIRLTGQLMARYSISPQNVIPHGHAPGQQTLCPGQHFPYERFEKDIAVL